LVAAIVVVPEVVDLPGLAVGHQLAFVPVIDLVLEPAHAHAEPRPDVGPTSGSLVHGFGQK